MKIIKSFAILSLFIAAPAFGGQLKAVSIYQQAITGGSTNLRSVIFDLQTAESWTCVFTYTGKAAAGRCQKNTYVGFQLPPGTYTVHGDNPQSPAALSSFIAIEQSTRVAIGCFNFPNTSCGNVSLQ